MDSEAYSIGMVVGLREIQGTDRGAKTTGKELNQKLDRKMPDNQCLPLLEASQSRATLPTRSFFYPSQIVNVGWLWKRLFQGSNPWKAFVAIQKEGR
jgi:hypothetical protein